MSCTHILKSQFFIWQKICNACLCFPHCLLLSPVVPSLFLPLVHLYSQRPAVSASCSSSFQNDSIPVHVCTYVCISIHPSVCVCTYVCTGIHPCVYVYICVHRHPSLSMYVYMCVSTSILVHVYTYVCTGIYPFVFVHMCALASIHVHVCIYVCISIHPCACVYICALAFIPTYSSNTRGLAFYLLFFIFHLSNSF